MRRCFFRCFKIFLGRNPHCDVWFVRLGRGGAQHVSSISLETFCVSCSSFAHDNCH